MKHLQIFESYKNPDQFNLADLILFITKNDIWPGIEIEFIKFPFCGISVKSFEKGKLLFGKDWSRWDIFYEQRIWVSYMERPNHKSLFLSVFKFIDYDDFGSLIGCYLDFDPNKQTLYFIAIEKNDQIIFTQFYDWYENKSDLIKQHIIQNMYKVFPQDVSQSVVDFLFRVVE